MQDHFVSVSEPYPTGSLLHFISERSGFRLSQNSGAFGSAVGSHAGTSDDKDLAKPLALIVDDVVDVTDMLSVFLSMVGYEVVSAFSAFEALAAARTRKFDVVISDIGMPQMNGYELAKELRRLPGYESVPLVAVTGFSMYDDRERSLNAGFNAHLTKPVDPNVLFQLIEQLRG